MRRLVSGLYDLLLGQARRPWRGQDARVGNRLEGLLGQGRIDVICTTAASNNELWLCGEGMQRRE